MRIILDASVSTVKRLRVSLGTLVAIEATAESDAISDGVAAAESESDATPGRVAAAEATAPLNIPAKSAGRRTAAFAHAAAAKSIAVETAPGDFVARMSPASASCAIDVAADATATEVAPADESAAHRTARADAATRKAEAAIERAFEAVEQTNRLMHPKAEGSDLTRINNAPLHAPTKVHASIGQLLNLAKRINTLTDGVFDPCTPARPGRLGDVEVSDDETEVVCHAPVALDFGGFAKGYAVDCAIEALVAGGCTAGLVNAGGDMRVFGQRAEQVFVRGPEGELTPIDLVNAAVAISDATASQRPPEHQGYYVRAVGPVIAATQNSAGATPAAFAATYAAVTAGKAVVADALAKCVLLCAPAVTAHVLQTFGATQLRSPADVAPALTNTQ